MWRRFMAEIAITGAAMTVLVTLGTARTFSDVTPRPAPDAGDPSRDCRAQPLRDEPAIRVHGQGRLCIGDRDVFVAIEAEGLTPGDVYEGWLAYVDRPAACAAMPCPLSDLVRPESLGILTRLEVTTVGDTRRARFTGSFRGLTLAQGSQLQLLLLGHGPRITGEGHVRQLLAPPWHTGNGEHSSGVVVARTQFIVHWVSDPTG